MVETKRGDEGSQDSAYNFYTLLMIPLYNKHFIHRFFVQLIKIRKRDRSLFLIVYTYIAVLVAFSAASIITFATASGGKYHGMTTFYPGYFGI